MASALNVLARTVIHARPAAPSPNGDGVECAFPRRGTLAGAGHCLRHRWRQAGSMRWLYKLFLNPAPLGSLISCPSISNSGHWLSLFVCVLAQVMYGVSAASRHFGGVVLLRLDPLAAGGILIGAG